MPTANCLDLWVIVQDCLQQDAVTRVERDTVHVSDPDVGGRVMHRKEGRDVRLYGERLLEPVERVVTKRPSFASCDAGVASNQAKRSASRGEV